MRTPHQLITAALGNPKDEPLIEEVNDADVGSSFQAFDVMLPLDGFRGLPPSWTFIVLDRSKRDRSRSVDEVVDECRALVKQLEPNHHRVILISDDPELNLSEEYQFSKLPVFCLDAHDLPDPKQKRPESRRRPFALAVRRRWHRAEGLTTALSPYLRETPVNASWRFFGRERELEELVFGEENIVVVGARRIGKTSLMAEAERRIKKRGENAFYVNVQSFRKARDIVQEIVRTVSPEDAADAARRSKAIGDNLLRHTLRRLSKHKTTLLIDELGNVLKYLQSEDWSVLGVLREFSQHGHLRIIVSCFQEYYLRQQEGFESPLINFGHVLRLGTLSESEIRDFVLSPIAFWKPNIEGRDDIIDLVQNYVGASPYLLAYFSSALFSEVMRSNAGVEDHRGRSSSSSRSEETILDLARKLAVRDMLRTMRSPIEEINQTILGFPTMKYLYLKRCCEADQAKTKLRNANINHDWVDRALQQIGLSSSDRSRTNLIDGLAIRGLWSQKSDNDPEFYISAPAYYYYLKRSEPDNTLEPLLEKLVRDIHEEAEIWGLTPCNPPTR